MSGAKSLTLKESATLSSSSATLCDPTPIATPSFWAASAKFRLTLRARSNPPVIEEIKRGALRDFPRNVVLRSISAKSTSGRAL